MIGSDCSDNLAIPPLRTSCIPSQTNSGICARCSNTSPLRVDRYAKAAKAGAAEDGAGVVEEPAKKKEKRPHASKGGKKVKKAKK